MGNENSHAADDSHDSWRAARENRNRRDNRASNDAVDGGSVYPNIPTANPDAGVDVERIFLYPKENAINHHTEKYELVTDQDTAVVRRAAKFNLAIKTGSRAIDLDEQDNVNLIFDFGTNGSVSKGTKVVLPVKTGNTREVDFSRWRAFVHSQTDNTLVVEVLISASAPVGIWKCKVETSLKSGNTAERATFTHPEPIYVLFNPYSRYDVVYMESSKLRDEYVQNDVGKVWQGSWRRYSGKHWVFGQFDDTVLPASCFILQQCMRENDRGNAVKVARAISKMVNANDDQGILLGNWQNEDSAYADGTAPLEWTGSIKILEEYMENKGKRAVKYGQCWVFSGVVVSICRALGIPCRSVTNFNSAHDTDSTCTIEKYYDEDGECISDNHTRDSIWNYHVWNDVWMARPDLPKGYDGWQCIDATPQEMSGGSMQCGPCPIEAVKKGEIGIGYDAPFVYAEVNADVVNHTRTSYGRFKKADNVNTWQVGRIILTKLPGQNDPYGRRDVEDITEQYKQRESTDTERAANFRAMRCLAAGVNLPSEVEEEGSDEDVLVEIKDLEKVLYGESYNGILTATNNSNDVRTIKASFKCTSVHHNGSLANSIKSACGDFKLEPEQEIKLLLDVDPSDYINSPVDYLTLSIYAVVQVVETGQSWTGEDRFVLEKPELTITVDDNLIAGKTSMVTFTFTNPLDVPLTNCRLNFEGSGAIWPRRDTVEDVPANGEFKHEMNINPRRQRWGQSANTLVAVFSSNEMNNVNGSAEVKVFNN